MLTEYTSKAGCDGEWFGQRNFRHQLRRKYAAVGGGELFFGIQRADKVTPVFTRPSLKSKVKHWMPDGTICNGISIMFIANTKSEGIWEMLHRDEWMSAMDLSNGDYAITME